MKVKEAIALLDAAADGRGEVEIKGVGGKFFYKASGNTYYMLEDKHFFQLRSTGAWRTANQVTGGYISINYDPRESEEEI